ncbi:hypothetical protein GEV33_012934 [Tenebrio molitor]|uniref:UDP-glucuronosyltransferase n=1 Tax=Tenebrio molitor TaxID=7067 RepID=A0A8J6L8I4_TENMO|nr:hypothetical protein GEV33_012934 [Tenebrio molitor]
MANPAPSSYVPTLSGAFTKHMNFWQRLQNFLVRTVLDLVRETIHLPKQRKIFKKYIDTDLELDDVLYNVSLIFANSHVSISDPLPLVPSIIEIGGYHISPPKKLPDDLQSFLDNAKDGVILFSMGSNLKSKDLSEDVRNILLKALSKVKQQVLWKFETDLADTPPNVKIMKWLPQQDILAHPNVRAFISHGGLLSTIETVYHGVPIVGIPVFGDQKNNIAAAMNNGFAVSMPLAEITEEKLSWALNEVLNNPTYILKMRRYNEKSDLQERLNGFVYTGSFPNTAHNFTPHQFSKYQDYQATFCDLYSEYVSRVRSGQVVCLWDHYYQWKFVEFVSPMSDFYEY